MRPQAGLSAGRLRLLVLALFTASFLGALEHSVVATSLAHIAGDLGALESVSWVVVSYTLASTVLLPVLGKLGDLLGARRVFVTSLGVFLVASLACGLAQDMTQLVVARTAQGGSSAGIAIMSHAIVAHVSSPRQRPRYLSVIGASYPVAIILGPVVGGVITDVWGWPWVFWINVPIGLVALVLAALVLPAVPALSRTPFDLGGALTFACAMVGLVLATTWAGGEGLGSRALAAFSVAAVAFVALGVVERRAPAPLVPLRAFRGHVLGGSIVLSAVIGLGLYSVSAYLPMYIQLAWGTSATRSGSVLVAVAVGMLASNLLTGWLASRSGSYWPYPVLGTAVAATGLLAMAFVPLAAPLWLPVVLMGVVGFGTGCFMNIIVVAAQNARPRSETGVITASVHLVRQIGSTVGAALIGAVIAARVTAQLAPAAPPEVVTVAYREGFTPVFVFLAATYAAGIVVALTMPRVRLSGEPNSDPASADSPSPKPSPVIHQ